ncbi:MAG: OmpA family protein [Elusimicrobia bacterium]|nr:OmpA family protein [Elusimicrobiota bacterium]MBU2614788.1 OmpA family protein [Elusimicrobiota bacterium]
MVINADGKVGQVQHQPLQIDLTSPQLSITASTAVITPNDDKITDETTFFFIIQDTNPIERWQLNIISSKNKTIKTYKSPEETILGGIVRRDVTWSGKDDIYSEIVPNGEYKAQITAFDVAGNKTTAETPITVKVPPKEIIKKLKQEFQELKISLSSEVLFDRNKASLKPEAYAALDKAIETIKNYPDNKVLIEGHTDISEAKSETELSSPRAWNVYSYLVKKGVRAERMSAKGWGSQKPIAPNTTRTGRMKNRRVEITISKEKITAKQIQQPVQNVEPSTTTQSFEQQQSTQTAQ